MKTTFRLVLSFVSLVLLALQPHLAAQTPSKFTTIYKFSVPVGDGTNATNVDGLAPQGVIVGADGNLYGVTHSGGPHHYGTAFKLTPSGHLTNLQTFGNGNGRYPANLVQGSDGGFYGTTLAGGKKGAGTVFRVTSSGKATYLHDFDQASGQRMANVGGYYPTSAMIEGNDGNYYGTTYWGGQNGKGVIYRIAPDGTFTTVVDIPYNWGNANGSLVQDRDDNFYGVTLGDVFTLMSDGTLTEFPQIYAYYSLAEGSDGDFYGVDGYSAYKITPDGLKTVLHQFGNTPYGADSSLTLASDGNFYGIDTTTTSDNQTSTFVYAMTPDGKVSTVYTGFTGEDGAVPTGGLVQAADGSFYGACEQGGNGYVSGQINGYGYGTVFHLIVAPAVTSADTAGAVLGQPFSYQVTGSLNPKSFGAPGLPQGLRVDSKTGLISGTPTGNARTHAITLKASNGGGTGTGPLTLTVYTTPSISSPTTTAAEVNAAFSYQIAATNSPTHFGVLGLPDGLHVDAASGVISGAPTATGTYSLTLNATGNAGTISGTLTLTIQPAGTPLITNGRTAIGTVGTAFSYQIEATNTPQTFGVLGLPPGIHVDAKTGLLSGTPTTAGAHSLTLKATNAAGVGEETLTLTIAN